MVVNTLEAQNFMKSLMTGRRARILADMKPLSELLKEWRETLKLSRAEAARRCEIAWVQWMELETGVTRDPRASTLLKLADGTGIPLERLVESASPQLVPA